MMKRIPAKTFTFFKFLVQLRGNLPDEIPIYKQSGVGISQKFAVEGAPSQYIEPKNKQKYNHKIEAKDVNVTNLTIHDHWL